METNLSDQEVNSLIDDANRHKRFDAANFVDCLDGSWWDVPHSQHGWRCAAREWGSVRGLVEENDGCIALTERGEAFKRACHERGVTIFA